MNKIKIKKQGLVAGILILIAIYVILYFTRTNIIFDAGDPIKVIAKINNEIIDYDISSSDESYKKIKDIIEEDFYLPSAKTLSPAELDSITIYFKYEGEQNEVKILSDGIVYLNQEHIQFKFKTNSEKKYNKLKNEIFNSNL